MAVNLQKTEFEQFLAQYPGFRGIEGSGMAVEFEKVSIDSRTLNTGDLFIALRGERHDGHDFIYQAWQREAAAVVVEQSWFQQQKEKPEVLSRPVIVVVNTLDFLQQIAAWHRRQFDIPVIGLTGSNGKTTTREMIAALLATRFRVFRSEGNKNNHIGLPLMLLELAPNVEIAVIEMGTNHPGEIALLSDITQPTAGVVTNIGKGHLGFFGSLHNVYREKISLLDAVPDDGTVFINMADPLLRHYPREGKHAITVGVTPDCDVYGEIVSRDDQGCITFRLNNRIDVALQIPGEHQLMNALLASSVALHYGIAEDEISETLGEFTPASQRMEVLEKNGVRIINDAYNANPDSMRAAVDYISNLKGVNGKRVLALGDMLELGEFSEVEHRQLGEYIASGNIDYVLLYGPYAQYIKLGIQNSGGETPVCFHYQRHFDITRQLNRILQPGDVLLLKGSRGMRMEKILYGLFEQDA